MPAYWMRSTARLLSLTWACCWAVFQTAEALTSQLWGEAILLTVLMLGAVAIAYYREKTGGAILISEAAATWLFFGETWIRRFDMSTVLTLFAIIVAPPLISGILFILNQRRTEAFVHHPRPWFDVPGPGD